MLIIIVISNSCQEKVTLRTDYSKIVFLSDREAPVRQFDIFVMNLDGSDQTNLTIEYEAVRSISKPVFSPDQSKILFVAFEKSGPALKLLDAESREIVHLCDTGYDVPNASFLPDGKSVLYAKKINRKRQIHIITVDGSNETNLSQPSDDEYDPGISLDGKKICFVRKTGRSSEVWVMNPDGSGRKKISQDLVQAGSPSISPDGRLVVFQAMNGKTHDIYLHDLRKNETRILYTSKANNTKSHFSPDGSKIVFLSNHRGMRYLDVYVYDFRTQKTINVSNDINYLNMNPSFSPEGKYIVFESVVFNDCEIYRVESSGENLTNLSNYEKWDCSASF